MKLSFVVITILDVGQKKKIKNKKYSVKSFEINIRTLQFSKENKKNEFINRVGTELQK